MRSFSSLFERRRMRSSSSFERRRMRFLFFFERRRMRSFFSSFESQRNRVSFFARVSFSIREAIANSNQMTNEKRLRVIVQHHMILRRLYMIESRATERRVERVEAKKK
jgi:hypothetical protein